MCNLFLTGVNLGSDAGQVNATRWAYGCRRLCGTGFMSLQRFAYLGERSKDSCKEKERNLTILLSNNNGDLRYTG